jgi:hypothetical protein
VPGSAPSIFRKFARPRTGDVAISGWRSPWVANRPERPDILRMNLQSSRCLALGSTLLSACSPATPEVAHPAPAGSTIQPAATDADPSVSPPAVAPDAQVAASVPEPAPSAQEPASAASERCTKDADCVPASCCHPAACVPKSLAPNCAAVMCTMECRPKTLDCGGHCSCVEGRCSAVLSDMSHLGPPSPR